MNRIQKIEGKVPEIIVLAVAAIVGVVLFVVTPTVKASADTLSISPAEITLMREESVMILVQVLI